ncbi:Mannose-6-phosphate isomerase [Dermatophilus congolensis]|uniref:mannose-6-phosphate isomerase n=1 Tax=Dermatophilus congolensis TaxID=1863 RepID=A0AA46BPL3_9MICO|nr:mannose-6-phosphate isomerase, class I [Dermatophilus congolensis]STD12745.1 Mannose-6-phosphate isomerase [Dermatophilus congolensis]
MEIISPCVKTYAWGSRHVIAELQGRSVPTEGPEAELWMGAHPAGPAGCVREGAMRGLDSIISQDPVTELGADIVARYGDRLPFMLKVLAADQALSIQVHPDRAQAERGFAAEEEAGIPLEDPARNYVDTWPKPEVLVALTDFEVLAGFRPACDSARLLRMTGAAALEPIAADLEQSGDQARLRAFGALLEMPQEQTEVLAAQVAAAAEQLAASGGDDAAAFAAVARMEKEHPGDHGVIASLLLQHLVLAPGEGLFMAAAGPHAYLHGAGVEVMGNSDNVLRAGLTLKHIDIPEVMRTLDPDVSVPVLRPQPDEYGVWSYVVPVPEFALYAVDVVEQEIDLPGAGPRILLTVEGDVCLQDETGEVLQVRRGESAYLSAATQGARAWSAQGARIFVATAGADTTAATRNHADEMSSALLSGSGHARSGTGPHSVGVVCPH